MNKTVAYILSFGVLSLVLLNGASVQAASTWKPVEGNLLTRWAKDVDPANPLPEYPRPQMVRPKWQNLNGLWRYAIVDKGAAAPSAFDAQILVPYPIESALSGVKKALQPNQTLWYQRAFTRPTLKGGERALLHFGAVDFEATVFVNGKEVGAHRGGYQNFSFDITDSLKASTNELKVKVRDPTDQGTNPRGKQVLKPAGIFYTATSGIWQTVWLETVPATFIDSLVLTPDVDASALKLEVRSNATEGFAVEAVATAPSSNLVLSTKSSALNVSGKPNELLSLPIPNAHLWSPDDPYLYNLEVHLLKNGKVVDTVRSYFGMRKVEVKKDANGKHRIFLNNQYIYNLGTLDQGFWPDGLYTATTDAALKYDVQAIKSMGFNTIRKHIKIEPARWYYHCDKLGIMVWQDMVPPAGLWNDLTPKPEARAQYEAEVRQNLAQLHNYPSITTWVLFNEGWGDYDVDRLVRWVKELDPSRLVNGHSGTLILSKGRSAYTDGIFGSESDLADIHSYPDPGILVPRNARQALVLGEYGGINLPVKDHIWINAEVKKWAYEESNADTLPTRYAAMIDSLKILEADGLTASIYTQPFDVEVEQNGLITYDRAIVKIPAEQLQALHRPFTQKHEPPAP